jgi:hypothetical protein
MRKIVVGAFVSLDGVMQAPGGPEEDPTGGTVSGVDWVRSCRRIAATLELRCLRELSPNDPACWIVVL